MLPHLFVHVRSLKRMTCRQNSSMDNNHGGYTVITSLNDCNSNRYITTTIKHTTYDNNHNKDLTNICSDKTRIRKPHLCDHYHSPLKQSNDCNDSNKNSGNNYNCLYIKIKNSIYHNHLHDRSHKKRIKLNRQRRRKDMSSSASTNTKFIKSKKNLFLRKSNSRTYNNIIFITIVLLFASISLIQTTIAIEEHKHIHTYPQTGGSNNISNNNNSNHYKEIKKENNNNPTLDHDPNISHPVISTSKYPTNKNKNNSPPSSSSSAAAAAATATATATSSTTTTTSSASASVSATTTTTQKQYHKAPRNKLQNRRDKREEKRNKSFLRWCQSALGIQTLLEIKDFEYINYYEEWKNKLKKDNDFDDDDDDDYDDYIDYAKEKMEEEGGGYSNNKDRRGEGKGSDNGVNKKKSDNDTDRKGFEPSKMMVRGLAATRDIEIDEVLISVPYHALITIHTTIDHDPVLSQILGPEARSKYGWTVSSSSSSSSKKATSRRESASSSQSARYSGDRNEKEAFKTKSSTGSTFHTSSEFDADESNGNAIDDDCTNDDAHNNDDDNNNNTNIKNKSNRNNDDLIDNSAFSNMDRDDSDSSYYEIGLLTVALLYHRSLGELSPIWFQIDTLQSNAQDIPLLWSKKRLRDEFNGVTYGPAGDDVRRLVLIMKKDVKDMYDEIMGILIKDHGDIFGRPNPRNAMTGGVNVGGSGNDEDEESIEWMFSYKKFEWAFGMVNSHKWHLPLADLDETPADENAATSNDKTYSTERRHHATKTTTSNSHSAAANSMPAQQPTDEFMTQQDEAIRLEYIDEKMPPRPTPPPADMPLQNPRLLYKKASAGTTMPIKHSFMAPLADMLNFGPPCAKGRYNTDLKAFEVIATCPLQKGQEVTFWYSDDCENIMIANYGFTNPMIPPCLSTEDWQSRSEVWRKYAQSLEKSLDQVYEELYETLKELEDCNNCGGGSDDNVSRSSNNDGYVAEKGNHADSQEENDRTNDQIFEEDGHSAIRRTKQRDHEDMGL